MTNLSTLLTVNTIHALKAIDPNASSSSRTVFVCGFDEPHDGGGGIFSWSDKDVAVPKLDGIAMASDVSGSWHRHYEGPIHTRWAGVFPTSNPNKWDDDLPPSDPKAKAANNSKRWKDLNVFCRERVWTVNPGAIYVVTNTIFLDSGVHDFNDPIDIGMGVGLDGNGPGRSVLRFRTEGSDSSLKEACVNVGDPSFKPKMIFTSVEGEPDATHDSGILAIDRYSTEEGEGSAFNTIRNVSILHWKLWAPDPNSSTQQHISGFSHGTEIGIAFYGAVRRSELYNAHVSGFGTNVYLKTWGMQLRSCMIDRAGHRNLWIEPTCDTILAADCRFDDAQDVDAENVLVNVTGGRAFVLHNCFIQRSRGVGLRIIGASSVAIRDCFFEANNRGNDGTNAHPDIWIEGEVRNAVIDGCYFTGSDRIVPRHPYNPSKLESIHNRAISIRHTSKINIQISNNEVAHRVERKEVKPGVFVNTYCMFEYFIDIGPIDADPNNPKKRFELVDFNNLRDTYTRDPEARARLSDPNSCRPPVCYPINNRIPPTVIVLTLVRDT